MQRKKEETNGEGFNNNCELIYMLQKLDVH